MTRIKPDDSNAFLNLGNAFYDNGQIDEAISAYQKAVRLNPDHYLACNNLGNALRAKGQLDQAIASYQKLFHPF